MTKEAICEKIREARYFTSSDMSADLYERFTKLRDFITSREKDSPHLLNKKNVTGIWYLTDLAYEEGAPQIIIRVDENNPELKIGSYTRMLLHGEIFDVLYQDVNYDYDEEINKSDTLIRGLQSRLFSEIEQGRILTVYDKEREPYGNTQRA